METPTNTAPAAVTEGTEVVTWGRDGARCAGFVRGGCRMSAPIWCAKVYRAQRRQRDGALTWRLVLKTGPKISGRTCPSAVVRYAKDLAEKTGHEVRASVTHGQPV